jgi:hypothetical protein
MKSTNLVLGMAVIALDLHLVKMKTEEANKTVDSYVVYVDSLENVAQEMLRQIGLNRGYMK